MVSRDMCGIQCWVTAREQNKQISIKLGNEQTFLGYEAIISFFSLPKKSSAQIFPQVLRSKAERSCV